MTTLEKLRSYIAREQAAGRLKPGDALPGLRKLGEKFGCFYTTAQRAVRELAREGVVRIELGNGVYLTGDEPLELLLEWPLEAIEGKVLSDLLRRHFAAAGVNAAWEIRSIYAPRKDSDMLRPVIHIGADTPGPCDDLHSLPDYKRWREHWSGGAAGNRWRLPFARTTYAVGVNSALLRKIGWPLDRLTPGFGWWNGFAAAARAAGVHPMSRATLPDCGFIWAAGLLLELADGTTAWRGPEPFFTAAPGKRLLEISADIYPYAVSSPNGDPGAFFRNGAVMAPWVGSWIMRQNLSRFRPDIRIDELAVRNFRRTDGRCLLPQSCEWLSARIPENFDAARRRRIGRAVGVLLSRDFQREYCNLTGFLSCRTDLGCDDYSWTEEIGRAFWPGNDVITVDLPLYPPRVDAMLETLCTLGGEHPELGDMIRKKMELCKNDKRQPSQYLN